MTHKHAEFLRAIADGESLDDWQYRLLEWDSGKYNGCWCYMESITLYPDHCEVRRKVKTHVVNGFTVPAPLRVAPAEQTPYFVSSFSAELFYSSACWVNDDLDKRWLDRGLVHLTEEAAIANAKAMCGIDPEEE